MSKYHARATVYNGHRFDSLAECDHYKKLLALEQAGKIGSLQVHPRFELQPGFTDNTGQKQRAVKYEADFSYNEGGRLVVEEVKGVETSSWRIKKTLFLFRYPQYVLRVIKV